MPPAAWLCRFVYRNGERRCAKERESEMPRRMVKTRRGEKGIERKGEGQKREIEGPKESKGESERKKRVETERFVEAREEKREEDALDLSLRSCTRGI